MSRLTNRMKRNDFLKEKKKTKQNKTQACLPLLVLTPRGLAETGVPLKRRRLIQFTIHW